MVMASVSASTSASGTRSFIRSCSASSTTIARTAKIPARSQCHSRELHSVAHSPLPHSVATPTRRLPFSIPYASQSSQIPGSTCNRAAFSCRYMSGSSGHDPSRKVPPGTFVTGTHWDTPTQTIPLSATSAPTKFTLSSTTPKAAPATTPNLKSSAKIWDSLKDQISSELAPETPSNTELNKKKLEAISKGKGEKRLQACSWIIGVPVWNATCY